MWWVRSEQTDGTVARSFLHSPRPGKANRLWEALISTQRKGTHTIPLILEEDVRYLVIKWMTQPSAESSTSISAVQQEAFWDECVQNWFRGPHIFNTHKMAYCSQVAYAFSHLIQSLVASVQCKCCVTVLSRDNTKGNDLYMLSIPWQFRFQMFGRCG